MRKPLSPVFGLLTVGLVTALAGCGGGSNSLTSGTNSNTPARFAGNYTGFFAGITRGNQVVSGDFAAAVNSSGDLTGSVSQPGLPVFSARGTVRSSGQVEIIANGSIPTGPNSAPINFESELDGTALRSDSDSLVNGTLLTKQNGADAVNGIFAAIRNGEGASPFQGRYAGNFTGRGPSGGDVGGSFTINVSAQGTARGIVTQSGLGQYPAIGTVDRAGNLRFSAIIGLNNGDNAPNILLSTLTGKATRNNSAITIAGSFNTTFDGQPNSLGTFSGARADVTTQ